MNLFDITHVSLQIEGGICLKQILQVEDGYRWVLVTNVVHEGLLVIFGGVLFARVAKRLKCGRR